MSLSLLSIVLPTVCIFLPAYIRAEQTLQCEPCEKAAGGCWDEHKGDDDTTQCRGMQENLILTSGWDCGRLLLPASCECKVEQKTNAVYPSTTTISSGVSSISPFDSKFFKLSLTWSASNANGSRDSYVVTLTTQSGNNYICCSSVAHTSLEMLLPYQLFDRADVTVAANPPCQKGGSAATLFHFPTIPLPSSCYNIPGSNPSVCPSLRYGPPQEVTVLTYPASKQNGKVSKMDALISWLPPSLPSPQYPLPALYYVDINFQTFFKTNATSVLITGLDASMRYQVSVETYAPCAASVCSVATLYKSFSCCTPFHAIRRHYHSDTPIEVELAKSPRPTSKAWHVGLVITLPLVAVLFLTVPVVLIRTNRGSSKRIVMKQTAHVENAPGHLNSSTDTSTTI